MRKRQKLKQQIINSLQRGIVNIKFRKKDGSIRDMKATLVSDLIGINTFSISKGPEHVQSVWDVEKGEWRSFRWDSLIEHSKEAM